MASNDRDIWARTRETWTELDTSLNRLLTFIMLIVLGIMSWAVAVFIWRELYNWYTWVAEPSFLLTFFAFPLPYFAYLSMINAMKPDRRGDDWLSWLGNSDSKNGTLVLFIFLFWSILYWNWPGIDLSAITISIWGLVTIFGLYLLRATLFRKPGREVPAPETSKS
jgi:hypothetical protein